MRALAGTAPGAGVDLRRVGRRLPVAVLRHEQGATCRHRTNVSVHAPTGLSTGCELAQGSGLCHADEQWPRPSQPAVKNRYGWKLGKRLNGAAQPS